MFWLLIITLSILVVYYYHLSGVRYNQICEEGMGVELKLKGHLSDKEMMKAWVREHLPQHASLLPRTHYKTKDVRDLEKYLGSDECPNRYVLKNTHGSRMNIVVNDKRVVEPHKIKGRARKFLATKFHQTGNEHRRRQLHYEYNDPHIIIEEHLGDVRDLKFHMVDGKLVFLQEFYRGKETVKYPEDAPRELVGVSGDVYKKINELAKSPIRLVRVDFFESDGHYYLGEITFSPAMCKKERPYLFGRI
jgi:hypothetical protein